MKRLVAMFAIFAVVTAFAGNNPTNPNSSYKNQYAKGSKGTKVIRKDALDRNYKKQGPLKVNEAESNTVNQAGKTASYKHPQGL